MSSISEKLFENQLFIEQFKRTQIKKTISNGNMDTKSSMGNHSPIEDIVGEKEIKSKNERMMRQTKLLKDTLDLLWNKTLEQQEVCEQLKQQNDYLEDYIGNLMKSSNVLEK